MPQLTHFLQGIVIGVANIIPGVSGGTLALVLGIYERLIAAIHAISARTVRAVAGLLRFNARGWREFLEEMSRIDAFFLIPLGLGAGAAIVALAKLMTYLLEKQHDPTYGFFFGLVLVSALVPYRLIRRKTLVCLLAALIAAGGVAGLSQSMSGEAKLAKAQAKYELRQEARANPNRAPATGSRGLAHFAFIFIAGALAISAMILPGISGSFILLLIGGYFEILKAIVSRDLLPLAVFALGCGIGLLLFTRFLNFLLARWHDVTMSFLLGLVLGSLWPIWPFQTSARVGGETLYLANRFPAAWGSGETLTLCAFLLGALIVAAFIWVEKRHAPAAGGAASGLRSG